MSLGIWLCRALFQRAVRRGDGLISTRAYGFSALASIVLIAASTVPAAHRFFAPDRGRGEATIPKLLVGGLSFSTSADRLREFLARIEGVKSATVVTDVATGQSRGFGFVEMTTMEAAETAMRQLNGQEFDGRQLQIELANPSGERHRDARGAAPGRPRW
jgi:RNA recognition motif-containing protein